MCKGGKNLRSLKDQDESRLKQESDSEEEEEEPYSINLFRIQTSEHAVKPKCHPACKANKTLRLR